MVNLLFTVIFICIAVFVPFIPVLKTKPKISRAAAVIVAILLLLSTSFIIIDADKVGHLTRIYFGKSMDPGQIIAFDGQKGPQAEILPPGFKFKLFLNVLYHVEELPIVQIPEGKYGYIVTRDGSPLKSGQYLANAWPEDKFKEMQNAEYFLKNGGQKGPQLTVLSPGSYQLNRFLYDVKPGEATDIEAGFVGVVKSNIQETDQWVAAEVTQEMAGALAVPLVKKGSIGVWEEPLAPGRYYLNKVAYNITKVDTRVQTWNYKGGYTRRFIDLEVTQDGKFIQRERTEEIGVPADAADSAIFTRMEGWLVPQELRVQVQVEPDDAAFIIASVGNVQAAENKVVTPSIRSVVRNICAAEKVIHLIDENRVKVEQSIESAVIPEGKKAGVTIKDVRLVDSAVPPELLVVRMREQVASQLQQTFRMEKEAQDQRILTEKSRATADQQPELVAAEIRVKIAEKNKEASKLKGEGEKLKLIEIARGQDAQVQVLGEDKVMQLAVLDKVLNAAVGNPDIVKIPHILVSGSNGGFEGAAAILGASNIVSGIPAKLPQKAAIEQEESK